MWISFSNDLQLCAMFDLHAVHERIRYEFYLAKFKQMHHLGGECSIEEAIVEKEGKELTPIFGPLIRTIVKVSYESHRLFEGSKPTADVYGITLQRNNQGEVCVVGYRSILTRKFLPQ